VLEQYDAETVRFFIVRAHYRSPLNYSDVHLDDARNALKRLYTALDAGDAGAVDIDWTQPHAARFKAAMDDDFGTPEAVAVLFELASEVNRTRDAGAGLLKTWAARLGLLQGDPKAFLQRAPGSTKPAIQRRSLPGGSQGRVTSPRPTASARTCWPRASCSRIPPHDLGSHSEAFQACG
jgi:cysteinyl-tRNA synthetase